MKFHLIALTLLLKASMLQPILWLFRFSWVFTKTPSIKASLVSFQHGLNMLKTNVLNTPTYFSNSRLNSIYIHIRSCLHRYVTLLRINILFSLFISYAFFETWFSIIYKAKEHLCFVNNIVVWIIIFFFFIYLFNFEHDIWLKKINYDSFSIYKNKKIQNFYSK